MISHKYKCIFVHIPKNAGSSVEKAFGFSDIHHKGYSKHTPYWRYFGHWSNDINRIEYPIDKTRLWEENSAYHNSVYMERAAEYFKFAIVRNPWDRLVSTWKYDQNLLSGDPNDLVAQNITYHKEKWGEESSSEKWLKSRREHYTKFTNSAGCSFTEFVRNIHICWYGLLGKAKWCNLNLAKNYPKDYPRYNWIKWHNHSQLTFLVDVDNNVCMDDILRFENLNEDWARLCDKQGWDLELPHTNKSSGKHYTEYYDNETRDMVARRYADDIDYFGYEFGD